MLFICLVVIILCFRSYSITLSFKCSMILVTTSCLLVSTQWRSKRGVYSFPPFEILEGQVALSSSPETNRTGPRKNLSRGRLTFRTYSRHLFKSLSSFLQRVLIGISAVSGQQFPIPISHPEPTEIRGPFSSETYEQTYPLCLWTD